MIPRSVALAAALWGLLACAQAHAIVSERHLRGVSALECDLEAGADAPAVAFRLLVDIRQRLLQLADQAERFPYEEASESSLRFPLAFGDGARMACELELPAGALSCAAAEEAERPRLGLCFPVQ
jgi:hypothetical protein